MDLGVFGSYGFEVAIALTAIMIAIGGITYGLAYAMDDRKLKETAKSELYQCFINAVLIGVLIALFANGGVINSLMNSVVGSTNSTFSCPQFMSYNYAICFANNYLAGTSQYTFMGSSYTPLLPMVTALIAALLALNVALGAIAGIKLNLFLISISFAGAISPFLKELEYIIGILTTLAVGISVQTSLLYFISLTAPTIILPLGLLLRAFRPSRKLGGFLVAVAIGMYVVFPLSYLFNAMLVSSYSSSLNTTAIQGIAVNAGSVKGQILGSVTASQNQTSGIVSGLSSSVSGILNSLNSEISSLLYSLAGLIVQVFILPVFSIVITVISIRELSGLLGSEAFFGRLNLI